MDTPRRAIIVTLLGGLLVTASPSLAQETDHAEREAMYYRYLEFPSYVKGGSVKPHWMADGNSFWYAEGAPAKTVFWKVDPVTNTKLPLFDVVRLREALTGLLSHEPPHQGIPFEGFTFVDEAEKAVKFTMEDQEFILQLTNYTITPASPPPEERKGQLVPEVYLSRKGTGWPDLKETRSPDGRWFAGIRRHNLWLRSTDDGHRVQITTDGIELYEYDLRGITEDWWSPDHSKLAVKKLDFRNVSDKNLQLARLMQRMGDYEMLTELVIVDLSSKQQIRIDLGEPAYWMIDFLRWHRSELLFSRMNRASDKLDLMATDPVTGATRVILSETQKTFVAGIFDSNWEIVPYLLEDGERFIWESERDGWNHLYLYDLNGSLIRQLTRGSFPVDQLIAVDGKGGWVYFTAHGDRQRPYDTQLYRVHLDGKGFTRLAEDTGQHRRLLKGFGDAGRKIQFSPSKAFFLVTRSTRAQPPVVELRRADGTLLQTMSEANIDGLKDLKWTPPEAFVVKAADGKTNLHGILYKPYDFDPKKQYPIIEEIYGGPHLSVMELRNTFVPDWPLEHAVLSQALAQLGFIVCVMDARGTPGRGKQFQDVVYKNMGRHEIADHATALKQLAEERPYMDLERVGIYGFSFGGYLAIRALLQAPEVYDVGIVTEPFPETLPLFWSYLGWPEEEPEVYNYLSNRNLASNLKGRLFLIHGDPAQEAVMKMVRALIQENKFFDLLAIPGADHAFTGTDYEYWQEAVRRYFVEHLKP